MGAKGGLALAAAAAAGAALYALYRKRRAAAEAERLRYNFAPASALDAAAFGSLRPGLQSNTGEAAGCVSDAEVAAWVAFVKGRGITRVLSFLGDDEAAWYASDVDGAMASAFGAGNYLRQSVHADGAYAAAKAFVDAAAADPNAKILFHCSGGVNRTSMGMAMWLGAKHGLSPGAAEDAIKAAAAAHGTTRKPSAAKLETFMTAGKLPLKTKKPRDVANH